MPSQAGAPAQSICNSVRRETGEGMGFYCDSAKVSRSKCDGFKILNVASSTDT